MVEVAGVRIEAETKAEKLRVGEEFFSSRSLFILYESYKKN